MSSFSTVRLDDFIRLCVKPSDSLSSAIEIINQTGYLVCLVCDPENNLLMGILTDGDIRQSLLKGMKLDAPVSAVMNPSPLVVSPDISDIDASRLMEINHFLHLPVVDSSGKLVAIYAASALHVPSAHDELLVIMAGGRGKRLMPLTSNCPKPMLPVNGKPILHHILESVKSDGFINISISVNYLAEQIMHHFGNGDDLGLSISYLRESKPLGTAGCLARLASSNSESYIVVINGDVITNVSLSEMLSYAKANSLDGLMAVRTNEWQNPFGVVHVDGPLLVGLQEKPIYRHQVNAGIYVLSPRLLSLLEDEEYCDMTDLFERAIPLDFKLHVYPLHESWIDIGRPSDYHSINLIS